MDRITASAIVEWCIKRIDEIASTDEFRSVAQVRREIVARTGLGDSSIRQIYYGKASPRADTTDALQAALIAMSEPLNLSDPWTENHEDGEPTVMYRDRFSVLLR